MALHMPVSLLHVTCVFYFYFSTENECKLAECEAWHTLTEDLDISRRGTAVQPDGVSKLGALDWISYTSMPRLGTPIPEFWT
jgi:hypothetical protein